MHSSRMRTDHLFTGCLLAWEGGCIHWIRWSIWTRCIHWTRCIDWTGMHPLEGGHPLERCIQRVHPVGVHPAIGCIQGISGRCIQMGHTSRGASWMHPTPVNRLTHVCENITFPIPHMCSVNIALSLKYPLLEKCFYFKGLILNTLT